jgi:hypothetical protein
MKIIALSLAALTLGACTATADSQSAQSSSARAETEFAEAVRGRVAGRPQACVQLREIGGNRSAGEDAIIFEGRSRNLIYVNRPRPGCPELRMNRALLTRAFSTQLCSGDIATVFDPVSGIQYGSCGLGDFVPYRLASR